MVKKKNSWRARRIHRFLPIFSAVSVQISKTMSTSLSFGPAGVSLDLDLEFIFCGTKKKRGPGSEGVFLSRGETTIFSLF